jgi:hypothetical protein
VEDFIRLHRAQQLDRETVASPEATPVTRPATTRLLGQSDPSTLTLASGGQPSEANAASPLDSEAALPDSPGRLRNAASEPTVNAAASMRRKSLRFMENLLTRHHVSLWPMSF